MKPRYSWIVTADARRVVLYSCRREAGGVVHIDPIRSIENIHEAEHDHQRPVLLGGAERRGSVARSSARAAPHSVSAGHTAEEEHRRFAREVGDWIQTSRRELDVRDMVIFAPPRFLGLLREQVSEAGGTVSMRDGELAKLRPSELAVHPEILNAISGG